MKQIKWMLSFGLVLLALLAATAYAESPGDQLNQMVQQLQKTPDDDALREKIIKLAQNLKPVSAVPEEAERRMARGEAAFESAKDVSGFENAIREFQAAANTAPWYSNAYFNLGIAQEKAGKAKVAMESFRFYLLSSPDGKDAADVKKRIYKLEYAAEQSAKEDDKKAQKDNAAAEQERFYKSLDGGVWKEVQKSQIRNGDSIELNASDDYIEVHGNHLQRYFIDRRSGRHVEQEGSVFSNRKVDVPVDKLCCGYLSYGFTISEDGKTITLEITGNNPDMGGRWSAKSVHQRIN